MEIDAPTFSGCAHEYLEESLRTEASLSTQKSALRDIALVVSGDQHREWERLDLEDLTVRNLRRIANSKHLSGHQQRKALAAFRGVAKIARERRLMDIDLYEDLMAAKVRCKDEETAMREYLEDSILGKLMAACLDDNSKIGIRDASMLSLAFQGGLRRNEFRTLTVEQVIEASEDVYRIHILGKGIKKRVTEIQGRAGWQMGKWLAVRGHDPGPLYVRISRADNLIKGQPLSRSGVGFILGKRLEAAGLESIGWHDFRRKCATDLYRRGIDLTSIQKLLGHSNQRTTVSYIVNGQEEIFDAATVIDTPIAEDSPV